MKKILLGFLLLILIAVGYFLTLYKVVIHSGQLYIDYNSIAGRIHKASVKKENTSNVILIMSNKSIDNEKVKINVKIDGKRVVNQNFRVEHQHTNLYYYFNLSEGLHRIEAKSEDGASLTENFEVIKNNKRWILITYWYEKDDNTPNLVYEISDNPFGFK